MASWNVLQTTSFELWFSELDDDAKEDIYAATLVLAEIGPRLGRPRADSVYGSKHSNMKELRVQSKGRPIRILFAFDPKRDAILLCGGDKTADKRFYEVMIKNADQLFDHHLEEIKNEQGEKKGGIKRKKGRKKNK